MPIETVVVLGGGVGGWLAASVIARQFPELRIAVVEAQDTDRSLGIATPVETLLPQDLETLAAAGIDEDMLVRKARGSFSLGTAFSGWRDDGATAFEPFGEIGAPLGPTAFHQLVARARSEGTAVNLANYALAALCAQSGRFARPRVEDRSVHSTLTYGLHIETAALARMLKADAVANGVQAIDGRVADAERDAAGLLSAIVTGDGMGVAGDLFIDASGPDSALSGPFESWRAYFPCDRAVSAIKDVADPPLPYAHVAAHAAGWQAFLPVGGAIGETYLYAYTAQPDGPRGETFESGRQRAAWRGNLVSIGGAAALIDPVTGTQLHLALADVARLIALFPNDRSCTAEAGEYNRQWCETTDCAFDFALLRLARNEASGPVWEAARAQPLPDRLAYRLALYESCGRIVMHDGETFDESAWVAHFDALGIRPRRFDALVQGIPTGRIEAHLARIREVMLAAVATMPAYAATLARIAR